MTRFHRLYTPGGEGHLPSPPEHFNNPFDYEPHPLCLLAANSLIDYVKSRKGLEGVLNEGKMLGVLVVEHEGETGYLAAFSGQIDVGDSDADWFVPAVFDYLQPDGYFKQHEREISDIGLLIADIENNPERCRLKDAIHQAHYDSVREVDDYKQQMAEAKRQRDIMRAEGCEQRSEEELIRESQFMKAELVRIKQKWRNLLAALDDEVSTYETEIERLKLKRQQMSEELQTWLFRHFVMLNARGERRDLIDIFRFTPMGMPPSGSGECCAPKLLQYAYANGMRPMAMAEFWWGTSPKNVIRHHLAFYPSCRGKCLPILTFMLEGVDVDLTAKKNDRSRELRIIYEDSDLLVVVKPAGMLSVPGKNDKRSVFTYLVERGYTPKIVHRLDMDTSGLLVVPLTVDAHHSLQRQFFNRTVKKRYVAIVEPVVGITLRCGDHGVIDLPLIPDPYDRPRQMIDYDYGKRAITEWSVVTPQPSDLGSGEVLLSLVPHTGRTHQLRVHCASFEGLASPIKGDPLYGHRAERMYLHAEYLEFAHPVTGARMRFNEPPGF